MQLARTLGKYTLIGGNAILNIATSLAILDHIAAYLNIDEGTDEHSENTRLAIVAIYAALVLGMEWRSAKRTTEEVLAAPQPAAPDGGANRRISEGWHSGAIAFDSWYKTIGKGLATAMVVSKVGGGAIAGTLAGFGLGAGGYLHARNPGLRPGDIIHRVDYPGQLTRDWRGLVTALLWAGVIASAVDNSGRYITAYKIAAHEIVGAFDTSDAKPYLDDDILFLVVACLSSAATIYSKFLLARNRSADIWNKHAAAATWRDWLRLIDGWAVLGAGAHSVLAYCNDRFLTQKPIVDDADIPHWLSLTGSVVFPSLGFLGTYATNADYGVLAAPNGYQPLLPDERKPVSANVRPLASATQSGSSSSSKSKPTPVNPPPSLSTLNSRRPSSVIIYDATSIPGVIRGEALPTVATADLEATRDLLSLDGGLSEKHFSSSPSPESPPASQQLGGTQPAITSIGSWLRPTHEEAIVGQPNANPPYTPPKATALLPSAEPSFSVVVERLSSSQPSNANLRLGIPAPLPSAESPLSPSIESSSATTEAKASNGSWFRFWGRGRQPTSSTPLLATEPGEPEYQAVPTAEGDSEQSDDEERCSIQ